MGQRSEIEYEVQDLLGFIALLQEARATKLLRPLEMSQSQFTVLFLLAQEPIRSWTVSELAQHMEMKLPGISKIVNQLIEKKLFRYTYDEKDQRKKWIEITAMGKKKNKALLDQFGPNIKNTFSTWSDHELVDFAVHLRKLKEWLDLHRL